MPLLALSDELLDRIFEHSDLKAVKSLRLANDRLRKVADRHLLRELPLYYNQESLDRIDALTTTHQDMAKGIQALWLQADRLEGYTFEAWNAERKEQYQKHSVLRDNWVAELSAHGLTVTNRPPAIDLNARHSRVAQISRDYLRRCYGKYMQLYTEQGRLDHSDAVREKCAAVFRVCPKLSGVWITLGSIVRRTSTVQSASFRKGLVIPCNYYTRDYDANVRIASQVLLGALDAGIKLETMVLGGVNYRLLTQGQLQMSKIAQVLQHVRHLQWDVGETFVSPRNDPDEDEMNDDDEAIHYGPDINDAEFDQMHTIFEAGHFSSFISNAANLQTLVMNMPELGSTQLRPVDFANIAGQLHFPQLKSFTLKRVQTTLHSLETFLLRHKDTLAELRLCDLYMMRDNDTDEVTPWQDFFLAIGGQLPHLKKVCLRGGFHDSEGSLSYVFGQNLSEYIGTRLSRAMEAFMLEGGATLPSDRARFEDSDVFGQGRAVLMEWAGDAIVPDIRPVGWDVSWEE